jgi:hypothetical protein
MTQPATRRSLSECVILYVTPKLRNLAEKYRSVEIRVASVLGTFFTLKMGVGHSSETLVPADKLRDTSNRIFSREILKSCKRDKFRKWKTQYFSEAFAQKSRRCSCWRGLWNLGCRYRRRWEWMGPGSLRHHHHQKQQHTSLNNVVDIRTTLWDKVMQVISVLSE